jgi:hypothetical protein
MRTKRTAIALALLAVAPVLAGCPGPKPVVVRQQLQEPEKPGEPYRLVVEIENRGAGEGQAKVVARLCPRGGGETVAQATQEVDMRGRETVRIDLPLQPTRPGPFDATVDVGYPPE